MTAREALSKTWMAFPWLDHNYMLDRKNGELFCDVGITIHPNDRGSLVGLWHLADLEASFGAGGYQQGGLHHLNMLDG